MHMTPTQLNHHVSRFGTALVAWNNIAALHEAARVASEEPLPVEWSFDPGTPAGVVEYLAGGAQGALRGVVIGVGVELLLAALFPAAALGYAVLGGAVLGAVRGATRVKQGWRVRVVYFYGRDPLLEVRRVA
jgi:hypothetical protein